LNPQLKNCQTISFQRNNYLLTFDKIFEFESQLAEFVGSPYAVMTDCCTHAIELCLRYEQVRYCEFTAFTYLSIPMTMHKLGISYKLIPDYWTGEYRFQNTCIWDSARRLEQNMYRSGMMQCLSFGFDKPLSIGRGGAILLDNRNAYDALIEMRYDGRNLNIRPWPEQKTFRVGYHYKPTPEEAVKGLILLNQLKLDKHEPKKVHYADLRQITIQD
jgi:dTDP-4-amino-4,6-dideoxygalactose transaminase